ncbi:uncharacterized protein PITG_16852 [Phytophthora infestans T30-4]|uniref:Uncharacterized protein n=1 Tax=Phytophthora infestans (strain T30-4) TaxID=403677 RepID=D0NU93_PHYIT|nr:uncharacterized protein PITG_16852 [Phytophthora infestans T30-4]EEY65226.1 hypothetical protein PITG_16852 [Phytophthora infestans T30-4]|eukprot:XP_002897290.1 hypothetical protein PITG_16852 [Phytophthora infestans T30-4]
MTDNSTGKCNAFRTLWQPASGKMQQCNKHRRKYGHTNTSSQNTRSGWSIAWQLGNSTYTTKDVGKIIAAERHWSAVNTKRRWNISSGSVHARKPAGAN